MRKKAIFMSAICAVSFVGQCFASDDVYVDLSVLDNVPQDSIGFVQTDPLFPIVKKVDKVATKSKAKEIKIEKKVTAPTKDNKIEITKEQQEEKKATETSQNVQVVVEDKPVTSLENNSDKTLSTDAPDIKSEDNKELTESVVDINNEDNKSNESLSKVEETAQISTVVPDRAKEDTSPTVTNVKPSVEDNQLLVPQAVISAKSADIIPENLDAIQPKEVYSLRFAEDSAELTEESVRIINQAIKDYDVEKKKKISIKAYNYDNGTDSFQKKRISLMRATEVRSYFLNQGFKNFSIKVINNTTADEYKNTVQIEELD